VRGVYEFDDELSIITYTKNQMIEQGCQNNIVQDPNIKRTYEYLIGHIVYSIHDPKRFTKKVLDVYEQIIHESGEVPSIFQICDYIDEENVSIIYEFYKMYNFTELEIDDIIAIYVQDVNCFLDDWIAEILRDNGYPYLNSLNSLIKKEKKVKMVILMPKFLK
jgi:hypothetical protein